MENKDFSQQNEIEKTREVNLEQIEITEEKTLKKEKKSFFKKIKEKWNKYSKKRKALIIILTILIVVAISLILYVFIFQQKQQKIIVAKDNFVYENGKLKLLDENEREIGVYECKNKDPNLCYVAFEDQDDDFDLEKTMYEDGKPLKTRSKIYQNKFAFIYDNVNKNADKIVLYNIKEGKIKGEYFGIKSYINKENYLVLRDENKKVSFYKIDDELTEIIGSEYDYLGMIEQYKDNILIVRKDKEWMLIDYNKEEISSKFEDEIKNYNEKYIILKTAFNKYRVVEYKSIEIFNDLDFVVLEEEIALVIQNKKLNIVDYENNQLINKLIELKNDNYIKTILINEKNKIINTKQSFDYELSKNNIDIKIYDDNNETLHTFNLLEGKSNINLDYYSYFDGVLYLYSDAEKNNFIGEYSCSNKNEIDDIDSKLSNCYPSSNLSNNLTIPMFYNRFIFIYDAPTKVNKNDIKVNLYDIKSSKILGNYIGINSDNGSENFVNVDEDYYVVASNKHEKLGILKIVVGKVTKATDFVYDELVKVNDIYFKAKKDNTNLIVSNTGVEDLDAFNGEHFRVKNNKGNYELFTKDNKKLLNNEFAYIELFKEFVAVVSTTNVLHIYDYNGSKLISDSISLASPTEFKIKTDNDIVTIEAKHVTYKYKTTVPWTPYIDNTENDGNFPGNLEE